LAEPPHIGHYREYPPSLPGAVPHLTEHLEVVTLKGTAKAPAVDLLRLKTLKGTKTAF